MVNRVESQSVYTDLSGLNSISKLGRQNAPEAMRKVAEQFESVFLNIMLKAMRDSNAVFSEGNYLSSNAMEFHQQNFDNQLSLSLTEGKGLGLADMLYEQMMGQYGISGTSRQEEEPRPLNDASGPALPERSAAAPLAGASASNIAGPIAQTLQQLQGSAKVFGSGDKPHSITRARHIESPRDFVKTLFPIAEEVASSIGVDPRVLLAQSALETGWGRKMIAMPDGSNSHNLFGIKADARWNGEQASVNTVEYRDGVAAQEKASFRSYGSYEESFRDYVKFLQENPRYQEALSQSHDANSFTQHLQDAGYATDPVYAKKIARVMNSNTMRFALSELQSAPR
jgi:flagellar protein FlgJ